MLGNKLRIVRDCSEDDIVGMSSDLPYLMFAVRALLSFILFSDQVVIWITRRPVISVISALRYSNTVVFLFVSSITMD